MMRCLSSITSCLVARTPRSLFSSDVFGIEEESISESLLNCAENFFVTTSFASLSEHEDEKGCT